jgi:Tol biopolymer transport system component
MSPERWQKIDSLFHAALEKTPAQRSAFLDEVAAGDEELRRQVESLLQIEGNGILDAPLWQTTEAEVLKAGARLGPYQIVGTLGEGGMGVVYRALDTRLGREIAIKTSKAQFSSRFQREARTVASLSHPNICALHDVGPNYLVMELIEGPTLAERIAQGPIPVDETLQIARQIADALEAAHERGIVHRDLKPANIKLMAEGRVKLLDFGLAKALLAAPGSPDDSPTFTASTTGAGIILGTAAYMSPEQAAGKSVDKRADIWSFGVVLWEMLTGHRLFAGDTLQQTLADVLRAPIDFDQIPRDSPPAIRTLLRRCLDRDIRTRLRDIGEARIAIEGVKTGEPPLEAIPEPAGIRNRSVGWNVASSPVTRRSVLYGAALAAGGAGLSYIGLRFRSDTRPPTLVTPLTMFDGRAQTPALSPDGKMVAFMWDGEHHDDFDIYLKVIGSGEPLRLTSNPRPEVTPLWSRDGRSIAFSRTQDGPATVGTETISIIPVLGGPERTVGQGFANDWSPDGTMFLALVKTQGQPASWCLVSAADGSSRPLVTTPPGSTLGRGRFSPDGRKVYYIEQTAPGESRLNEVALAGGAPRRVPIPVLSSIHTFAWAGANDLILAGRTFQSVVPRFYRVPASGGVPDPLPFGANGSDVDTFPGARSLVYSYDELSENIWRVGAWPGDRRQPRKWINADGPTMNPAVSPTGDRIAFASSRSGSWAIWTSDGEGNAAVPAVRFPSGATKVGSPAWSPDGSQIAFDVGIGNSRNILVVTVGSGERRRLTEGNGSNIVPAWSPDGRWIYYTSSVTNAQMIWRVPAAGGQPRQITRHGGYSVKVSPDGKYLYYLKSSREGELWRASAESGEEELVLRELKNRNFWVLPDGVYLLDPGVSQISPLRRARARFYRFRTRKIEDLGFETEKPVDHYGICLSPDAKWLYYVQVDRSASNIMLVENFH